MTPGQHPNHHSVVLAVLFPVTTVLFSEVWISSFFSILPSVAGIQEI